MGESSGRELLRRLNAVPRLLRAVVAPLEVCDVFIASGIGFTAYGAGLYARPLGFVVLGVLLLGWGLPGALRAKPPGGPS